MIKVSIGIPAYNEANNIKVVLKDILTQKENGWKLTEILVYSDGSSDGTAEKAAEVKNNLIRIFDDHKRLGKTFRLTQMFKQFKGDILIMFDGDIKFDGKNVITEMTHAFADPKVMLSGGNSQPFAPKSFFQRSVYTTFSVFYKSRSLFKEGNNIFGCTGSILGIRKSFAKNIKLPAVINEDAYLYLECIKRGFKFKYQDNAVIFYKLPTHLKDYLRQLFRSTPDAVDAELEKYFGKLVEKEFKRSKLFYVRSIIPVFIKNPLEVSYVIFINLICKPFYPIISKNYKLSWFTAGSTH